jgi:hypothetical protein
MIKNYIILLLLVQFITFAAWAQNLKQTPIAKDQLQQLAINAQHKLKINQQFLKTFGAKNLLPLNEAESKLSFTGFTQLGKPLYYMVMDTLGVQTISAHKINGSTGLGLNLTGSGMRIAQWDQGRVKSTHEKLLGRIGYYDTGRVLVGWHATLVASAMGASDAGTSAGAKATRGIAPNLTIDGFDYVNDEVEIIKEASGTGRGRGPYLVSNHSYGYFTGWGQAGGAYYWAGDTTQSTLEDHQFGWYGQGASLLDSIANFNPNYLMVWAAGNSRGSFYQGPHFVWNGTAWVTSTGMRSRIGTGNTPGDGFDCMLSQQTAKNILTVGAILPIAGGYTPGATVTSSAYSSYGPTDDGRIKPDVVADGDYIVAASTPFNDTMPTNFYRVTWGTSNASPFVASASLLQQEYYMRTHSNRTMLSSTLKNLIIHTCDDAGNTGPDYSFGWGIANAAKAALHVGNDRIGQRNIIENTLQPGDSLVYNINFTGIENGKITLTWNDPAGNATPENIAFDNPSVKLINDLDMRLIGNNNSFLPFILNRLNVTAPATTGNNNLDNVEQIIVPNPSPTSTYQLIIKHKGNLQGNKSQKISLLFSGQSAVVMPFQFLNFTGRAELANNQFSFTTENEGEVINYVLQRSRNNANFEDILSVNKSTSGWNYTSTYNTEDNSNLNGVIFYKIKAVLNGGKFAYSKTISLQRNNTVATYLFPNPVKNNLQIAITSPQAGGTTIQIFDNAGKLVLSQNNQLQLGFQNINIPVTQWAAGIYYVKMRGVVNYSKKILISR